MGDCSGWFIFCADAVYPYEYAAIHELQGDNIVTRIEFSQEAIYTKIFGITEHIKYKVTVKNPVMIRDVNYTCTILGDGTVHHWGIDFKEYPPAEIYMRCLSQKKLEEQVNNLRMIE